MVMAPGPPPAKTRPPSLYPILAVTFVGALGFSIVLPFLVFLVTRLGGNAVIYGVVGATYSVFQLIGAPILGRWSDRVGRKKVLLLSQLGTLASWGIFLFALTLPVRTLVDVDSSVLGAFTLTVPLAIVFLARALDGATGGNVSVANAYLADITSDADRSANYGRMACRQAAQDGTLHRRHHHGHDREVGADRVRRRVAGGRRQRHAGGQLRLLRVRADGGDLRWDDPAGGW